MGTSCAKMVVVVCPITQLLGFTSGSIDSGMSNRWRRSLSHSRVWILKSMVREAFVTSVTCTVLRVRHDMSQVSTVPNFSRPASARSRAPGTLSRIHFILVAEKYASIISPVFSFIISAWPASRSESQYSEVRLSCHTIALYTGSPVSASHTMVVSRWLVIPMAAMLWPFIPIRDMASAITDA